MKNKGYYFKLIAVIFVFSIILSSCSAAEKMVLGAQPVYGSGSKELDAAEYLENMDALRQKLQMDEGKPDEESFSGVYDRRTKIYIKDELTVRINAPAFDVLNRGKSGITFCGIHINDKEEDINSALINKGWEKYDVYQSTSDPVQMITYRTTINKISYLASFKIENNKCIEWYVLRYTSSLTDLEASILKEWFAIPEDIQVKTYQKYSPNYWEGAGLWNIYITMQLDNGGECGAEVDPVSFKPQRTIYSDWERKSTDETPKNESDPDLVEITEKTLQLKASEAAEVLGFLSKEKADYEIFYTTDGQDIESQCSYMHTTESKEESSGLWDLVIVDKNISFLGITVGMEISSLDKTLDDHYWECYDTYEDEDTMEKEYCYERPFEDTYVYLTLRTYKGQIIEIRYDTTME